MQTLKTILSDEFVVLPSCYDDLIDRPIDSITEIHMSLLDSRLRLEVGKASSKRVFDRLQQAALVEFMAGRINGVAVIEYCLRREDWVQK